MSSLPSIVLKKPPQGSLRFGHPWVYRDQLLSQPEGLAPGQLADLVTTGGRWMGRGYWNPQSEIVFRVLTFLDEPIDLSFFERRFQQAHSLRSRWVRDTNAFRLISSEADGLPGLVIDCYGDVQVVQFLTLGMEQLKPLVLEALSRAVPSRGVYERGDAASRKLEGLQDQSGWIRQDCGAEVEIVDRDIRILFRVGEGHKTGFYLDQRENRLWLRDAGLKGRALDVFCYEGAFALHLARSGMSVTAIDTQGDAIRRGEGHRNANKISSDQLHFVEANAFDELKRMEKAGEVYDLVILDPPSFGKTRSSVDSALTGYKELCLRAFKLLRETGHLALFSCSFHIDENRLMQSALSAARDTGRTLKVLRFFKQSMDHPIDPFIPETYYLKGFFFQVGKR